jgi:hypothetical protein
VEGVEGFEADVEILENLDGRNYFRNTGCSWIGSTELDLKGRECDIVDGDELVQWFL